MLISVWLFAAMVPVICFEKILALKWILPCVRHFFKKKITEDSSGVFPVKNAYFLHRIAQIV